MRTYKLSWETMDGTKRTSRIRALSLDQAITELCHVFRVGNLFAAWDGGGNRLL